jgi:arsenite oxidase small subunit
VEYGAAKLANPRHPREEGSMAEHPEPSQPEGGPRLLTRKQALAGGGAAVAALGAPALAEAAGAKYPTVKVLELAKLKVNRAVPFAYPLEEQQNVLLDMGRSVPEGVGPKRSIVAFSILCQHMGCPVAYRPGPREFFCPCHQTRYDPERSGSIIEGLALRPLPRVLLSVRHGVVYAIGLDGLVYGYRDNLRPGERVGGGT